MIPHTARLIAGFAWHQMTGTERWALYDGTYSRLELADRFGDAFLKRGHDSAYAALCRLCEDWIAAPEVVA